MSGELAARYLIRRKPTMSESDVNFEALLSQNTDEVEKPKPLPAGTYQMAVKEHAFDTSSKKGTPYVRFQLTPVAPGEDVDQELLAQVNNWNQRSMKVDFYLTQDAVWRLKDFLEACGINTSGRTFAELIPETAGAFVSAFVKHEISGEDTYANIDRVTAAE